MRCNTLRTSAVLLSATHAPKRIPMLLRSIGFALKSKPFLHQFQARERRLHRWTTSIYTLVFA